MTVINVSGRPVILIQQPQYFWRIHYRLLKRLPMWVIYRPITIEYPGKWVARMHITLPEPRPTRFVMSHDSLWELRQLLPPGVTRLRRDEADSIEIEETWL